MRYYRVSTPSRYARALIALALFTLGASGIAVADSPGACPETGATVYLKASGGVLLNGRPIEASQLKDALSALKPRPTMICYSRDNPQGDPPSNMAVVMDALIAQGLPVGLFTDASFATPASAGPSGRQEP